MADNTKRIAGTAFLSVDGVTYPLVGAFSYNPTKVVRKTMAGQDDIHGYSEMPATPFIKASIRDSGGLTVADFNAMTNVTVVCELSNGKVVTGRNLWQVGEAIEVETEEAKFEVQWEGVSGSVVEDLG